MLTRCWINVNSLPANPPHPGLRIWDFFNGDRSTKEEQPVPGCSTADARPPGGGDWYTAERCRAKRPGHRQGNHGINTAAGTISVRALGPDVINPCSIIPENGILAVRILEQGWWLEVGNYWAEWGHCMYDLWMRNFSGISYSVFRNKFVTQFFYCRHCVWWNKVFTSLF